MNEEKLTHKIKEVTGKSEKVKIHNLPLNLIDVKK